MKLHLLTFLLLGMLALIISSPAKSGVGSFLLNSALKVFHPIKSVKNISYGEQTWQKLNVYPQKNNQNAPVVFFIYGGGWSKGSKEQYHFVADGLSRLGYMVVIADYIKYPEGRYPTFIEDIALATAWVKQNIKAYGGNAEQILLAGHSAGAHTGALLVTDHQYLAAVDLSPVDFLGFVGLSGPYNFTPKAPQYIKTFGQENFESMKVNNHVQGAEPPIKLIHGRGDQTVGLFNFDTFRNKLQASGHNVITKLYDEDIGHVDTVLKIHPWFAGEVDVAVEIDVFFKSLINATTVSN
ncbi:alpha/beta hydrolase [Marinicella litoralis]|uniref:Acetyl esterase/lipase n=1 Tax=Marinicella litoralis TaxID=644220 RepID=A0A4R6XV54_9GAMM|nr:alpha/beta hydrolase [Marinicella litoralis]TDR22409.1 acetyl esterase/lipase [Marinicella litoralis]